MLFGTRKISNPNPTEEIKSQDKTETGNTTKVQKNRKLAKIDCLLPLPKELA